MPRSPAPADEAPESTDRAGRANRDTYAAAYGAHGPVAHLLRAALSWDQQAKAKPAARMLAPVLRRRRDAGLHTRVLDYGCGWGGLLLSLPRSGLSSWGYDIVPGVLEGLAGAMRLTRRRFDVARVDPSGRILPGDFDVVVCSHVLEHVPDDRALLARLHDALAPRGLLLVNVPVDEIWSDPRHRRRYDAQSLRARLLERGFRVLAEERTDRLSAALLRAELRGPDPLRRSLLRVERLLLALAPLGLRPPLQRLVAANEPLQQLLVLSRRGP